jgi:small subunit ribosomal protein S18
VPKPPIRKPKKKVCQFCKDKATYIDYKDTTLLRKFISDSREMALLPYTSTAR